MSGVEWTDVEREAAEDAMSRYGFNVVAAIAARHVLAALAPFVAAREAQAAARALRDAAREIEAQLVCCGIYEASRGKGIPDGHHHAICYWSSAAAGVNLDMADRIERGES